MDIFNALENKINIIPNSKIVLGVSGGSDSMALLFLMQQYIKKYPHQLIVAHVNHNVRLESKYEEEMITKYCLENNLILEKMTIENYKGYNFHAEARDIRYNFFEKIIEKYQANYLFTAHHNDDLIETIFMRLIRGSSLKGYAGIKLERDMGDYKLIRPLLYYGKDELLKIVKDNNIFYNDDITNMDNYYLRNNIRNNILPIIKEYNIKDRFLKYSELLFETNDYIEKVIQNKLITMYKNNVLDLKLFAKEDNYIKKKIIENILLNIYRNKIELLKDSHVLEIMKIISSKKPNLSLKLPNDILILKAYHKLIFNYEEIKLDYDYVLEDSVSVLDKTICYVKEESDDSNYVARFSLQDIKLPLHIKNNLGDEKMNVRGLSGHQKINKIFKDSKVPVNIRCNYPIVTDDNGVILWIPGIKKGNLCKRKNETYDIILKYL